MEEIHNLDQVVLQALDFFVENPPPAFDVNSYELPFVVGSGNAYNTGLILFSERAAVFADESNFRRTVDAYKKAIESKMITKAVIISASGGKDSVWEIELAKQNGLEATLLTTKGESDAAKIADNLFVFQSITEPYTYNTSTYMGMIIGATHENPKEIKDSVLSLKIPENFGGYNAYSFVLPDKYMSICPMLEIKKSELFGPKVSLRAFSQGHARHAKFVIRAQEELVISIGQKNEFFGDPGSRWDIFPQQNIGFAGIMALIYFIVGKIQESKPPYFKENIDNYVSDYGPKAYGPDTKPFELIVPGTT
jgi:hypothetical protein